MGKRKKEVIFLGIIVMTLLAMLGIQQRQMKQYTEVLGRNVENTSNTTAAASGSAAGAERQPVVYLTFDDGPSSLTEKYLDILKKHKIHATFFLIGQQVEEMPEIVERELKEGHEIGVHTYTHESCEIYASCQAYYEDVNKVRDVLERDLIINRSSGVFHGAVQIVISIPIRRRSYRDWGSRIWNMQTGMSVQRIQLEVLR